MKILFIAKQRKFSSGENYTDETQGGSTYYTGLINGSRFIVNYLLTQGVDAVAEPAIDANCIDKFVHKHRPSVVVLEGLWVTPAKLTELQRLHPKVKWYARLHSKTIFLANEGIAYAWSYDYLKIPNVTIAVNHIDTATELSDLFGRYVEYLPNVYFPRTSRKLKDYTVDRYKSTLDIGCFGAVRPLKNTFVQAVAAILFCRDNGYKLRFHINKRAEQWGEQVLKNLQWLFNNQDEAELVEHGWLSPEAFNDLLYKSIDISLQVSLTESHNLVIADSINNGVLPVVSKEISWLLPEFQSATNDIYDIVKTIKRVWNNRFYLQPLSTASLHSHVSESATVWKRFLDE